MVDCVFVIVSSHKNGLCQRLVNALTTVNVTFSYPVNDTKETHRNQTGMKLNLGFSCGPWPAVTAVLTVPPKPNKTRPACSCFLVPQSPSLSPFFSSKKEPLTFGVKYMGWGLQRGTAWGVGCLEPSVNS